MGKFTKAVKAKLPPHIQLKTKSVDKWNQSITLYCRLHKSTREARSDLVRADMTSLCKGCSSDRMSESFHAREDLPTLRINAKLRATKSLESHKVRWLEKMSHLFELLDIAYVGKRVQVKIRCLTCKRETTKRSDSYTGCRPCQFDTISRVNSKPIEELVRNDPDYMAYRDAVGRLTGQVFRRYSQLINPKEKKRGKDYHLDHRYSIVAGYQSTVANPPKVHELAHPCNLRMVSARKNQKKNARCCISITTLRRHIRRWNKRHGNPFTVYRGNVRLKDRQVAS